MNTRFYNARICSMEKGTEMIEGELWVEENRVTHLGDPAGKTPPRFDEEIDAQGNLLLPGFKNAHTHSAMTFLRSYADDLPLLEWLEKQVFPMEAKLTGDDVYWLARLAILEYLTSGITANFDMYMFMEDNVRATIDSGFRTVFCSPLSNFVSSPEEMERQYITYNQKHPRVSAVISMHAEYTCSQPLLEQVAGIAQRHKAPVYTHNSETRQEVEQCIQRTGKTPTVYMDSLGLFDYGGGGYHCVHMTEQDLEIVKKRKMFVVTNPGSNCKLASGIAPLTRMMQMGIPLALGTDGPASNNCLDFFREMFLATAMQKIQQDDASALEADKVLTMACCTGAHAMGLEDCDSLAVGKLADLIMLDLQQPNMQPLNNITKNVVYSGSKQNVKLTMVNGRILYRDGSFFVDAEPAEIYAKANEIIQRLQG